MDIEQIHAEIGSLIEQGASYHQQGRHALSLQSYQKAMTLAIQAPEWMPLLLADAGGEHRDCDNYTHAFELLITALSMLPDTEDTRPLRARIKKLLAITFKDIYGPQKPEVLELLEESRADYIHSGNVGQEANILQHIGGCYVELGRFAEADRILHDALQKALAAGDLQLQSWILDDMANLEIENDQWGLALDYTRNARDKVRGVQDQEGEGDTWITEARIQLRLVHFEDALAAATRALDLYAQNKNLRRTIRAHRHLGKVLIKLGREEEALVALNEAVRTATSLNLLHDQTLVYLDLGKLELERKNYGLAHQYATYARRLADEESLSDLLEVADDLQRRCRYEEDNH